MKKCITIAAMLVAVMAFAQGKASAKGSLADARSKIDKIIATPATIKGVMRQLSAQDQRAFLAELNKAVSEMPSTLEEKAALFLSLNTLAVANAEKGNATAMFAEVFATVPPEALTVISERFPSDLLARNADPNTKMSDAQYEKIALNVMEKVNERCEATDNPSTRETFAILTLVRSSGGTSQTLIDHLVDTLKHEDAREMAKNEWIPGALGSEGREQSYEPLLASADAGRRPDLQAVLPIAGPTYMEAVKADLTGKSTESDMFSQTQTPVLDAVENLFGMVAPRVGAEKLGAAAAIGGAVHGAAIEAGEVGGGDKKKDTRPNPANPDPQGTGQSPIPTPTPGPTPPGPTPPGPYPYQNF